MTNVQKVWIGIGIGVLGPSVFAVLLWEIVTLFKYGWIVFPITFVIGGAILAIKISMIALEEARRKDALEQQNKKEN